MELAPCLYQSLLLPKTKNFSCLKSFEIPQTAQRTGPRRCCQLRKGAGTCQHCMGQPHGHIRTLWDTGRANTSRGTERSGCGRWFGLKRRMSGALSGLEDQAAMAWGVAGLGKGVTSPPCRGVRLCRPQSSRGAEDHGAATSRGKGGACRSRGEPPQQSGRTFPEAKAAQGVTPTPPPR